MARRRWLLFALSIASLVVLIYASVLIAFSVPVTDEMRAANGASIGSGRAIVLPLANPGLATTVAADSAGALLLVGERHGAFPASASDLALARALAFVPAGAPATIEVANVTMPNGTTNLTIDLAALGAQGEGFVVKGDAEESPRFVPAGRVIGSVDHVESTVSVGMLFLMGALGFVSPLVALIVTHRGAGRRGLPRGVSATSLSCRACRAPLAADATFCTRCGEYREPGA